MKDHNHISFNSQELVHYGRQLSLPEFGMEGQQKLKTASVLVVGAGGLGAPVLQYLAAAGVGTIGIVDFDKVEASNLHRQVLFGASDIGRPKVEVARERLQDINPHIKIRIYETRLTADNALDILESYDLLADCSDNFPTRYLVNDASILLNKPNIFGAVSRFEGQVSVFHYLDGEGKRGPNYRDLFPEPPQPGSVPNCAEAGVLGVLPGIVGCMQANEIIKVITGVGSPLSGSLFLFDALGFQSMKIAIPKREDNPLTGKQPTITKLIDYQAFCGTTSNDEVLASQDMTEVSVRQYNKWLEENEDIQLIDVREPREYERANMGGKLIPLRTIEDHIEAISRQKKIIVHCKGGQRSKKAISLLREKYGFDNLYNLKGGLHAWFEEKNRS